MAFITWDKCYSVLVEDMDKEHKKIINIINELDVAINEEKVQDVIGDLIQQMIDYVKTHFANEEKFMAEIDYPDLERHQNLHSGLIEVTRLYYNEYKSGQEVSAEKLMVFLWNWLLDHIMSNDKGYGLYYTENRYEALAIDN